MRKNRFAVLFLGLFMVVFLSSFTGSRRQDEKITDSDISAAGKLIGLKFSAAERDSLKESLNENRKRYEAIRKLNIANSVPPSLLFNPIPAQTEVPRGTGTFRVSRAKSVEVPKNLEKLAFYSVRDLAELIRTRKVTSLQLTKMYLKRLKRYDPKLKCVVTLTEDRALQKARQADAEIAAGNYRGLLHGIPYGVKDLLAVKGYRTTWGAMPYKDQMIDETATVVKKLDEAGAVLVAKLTLGALAWGDVWFGGKTRNPWNLEQGSSGSSAGPAAATSAGLVAFSIGSETWGSIVSPATRVGVTGLRPTFGMVSRAGAMALSWSMDKLGPITRTVEDAAIVLNVIRGSDGIDQSVVDAPLNYDPDIRLADLRIGYLKSAFDKDSLNRENNTAALKTLQKLGAKLIPVELPDFPIYPMSFILSAEAAAAFDELTLSGRDSLMVRQIKNAWPNVFRASRFIPAVEYIQANRARYLVIQKMAALMKKVDVYITPSFGPNLLLTNLTGHPAVVVPNGFNKKGGPVSISFIGGLYKDGTVLEVANAYQRATDFYLKHPPLFTVR